MLDRISSQGFLVTCDVQTIVYDSVDASVGNGTLSLFDL
jgi:hypothetical protein